MKPLKLSELIEALEFESEESGCWVDLQTGTVAHVDQSLIRAIEEDDEEALDDLAEWQKKDVQIARAIVEDPGQRFVSAPTKFDFHEYRQMERFIGELDDPDAAEQLQRAIKGKGAFRHFKDTANRLGLLEKWFQYRDRAMKEFARAWAQEHQVPILDDASSKPQP